MSEIPITAEGAERLRKELHHLKTVDRPRITEAIAEARAHGDLKENAEYHAAREQQGFSEARIGLLEGVLSNARVIDIKKLNTNGRIVFGATVELINDDTGDAVNYQIVGDAESDISQGRIAISSPIARALIGKEEGDVAEVKAPAGITEYEITTVRYV
ncbi:Transcription elongation factor GreA [hydrothermal vent metagenome]|uniref:Transcription elongation factor GreA n=1 Tax=hydrothermal vent metagenome TaxID=652676 RepID=A0A3B0Z4E6_9ZZZZ